MEFELGRTYSGYKFLDVVERSRNIVQYRVQNTLTQRLENLRALPATSADDPDAAERFLREVRVRARLAHPHIVTFYNALPVDGQMVMTTEVPEALSLAERLKLGPLPWAEALALTQQLLDALTCLHSQALLHCGLTPQSVLFGPVGFCKLAEFAWTRPLDPAHAPDSGAVLGDPRYISPEQIRGERQIDIRSDFYSLGVVLYEMLTGHPPFESRSQFELMLAHVNQVPVLPSQRLAAVPTALDELVMKALAKAPSDRYQSAVEFTQAIEASSQAAGEKPRAYVNGAAASLTTEPATEAQAIAVPATGPVIEPVALDEATAVVAEPEVEAEPADQLRASEPAVEELHLEGTVLAAPECASATQPAEVHASGSEPGFQIAAAQPPTDEALVETLFDSQSEAAATTAFATKSANGHQSVSWPQSRVDEAHLFAGTMNGETQYEPVTARHASVNGYADLLPAEMSRAEAAVAANGHVALLEADIPQVEAVLALEPESIEFASVLAAEAGPEQAFVINADAACDGNGHCDHAVAEALLADAHVDTEIEVEPGNEFGVAAGDVNGHDPVVAEVLLAVVDVETETEKVEAAAEGEQEHAFVVAEVLLADADVETETEKIETAAEGEAEHGFVVAEVLLADADVETETGKVEAAAEGEREHEFVVAAALLADADVETEAEKIEIASEAEPEHAFVVAANDGNGYDPVAAVALLADADVETEGEKSEFPAEVEPEHAFVVATADGNGYDPVAAVALLADADVETEGEKSEFAAEVEPEQAFVVATADGNGYDPVVAVALLADAGVETEAEKIEIASEAEPERGFVVATADGNGYDPVVAVALLADAGVETEAEKIEIASEVEPEHAFVVATADGNGYDPVVAVALLADADVETEAEKIEIASEAEPEHAFVVAANDGNGYDPVVAQTLLAVSAYPPESAVDEQDALPMPEVSPEGSEAFETAKDAPFHAEVFASATNVLAESHFATETGNIEVPAVNGLAIEALDLAQEALLETSSPRDESRTTAAETSEGPATELISDAVNYAEARSSAQPVLAGDNIAAEAENLQPPASVGASPDAASEALLPMEPREVIRAATVKESVSLTVLGESDLAEHVELPATAEASPAAPEALLPMETVHAESVETPATAEAIPADASEALLSTEPIVERPATAKAVPAVPEVLLPMETALAESVETPATAEAIPAAVFEALLSTESVHAENVDLPVTAEASSADASEALLSTESVLAESVETPATAEASPAASEAPLPMELYTPRVSTFRSRPKQAPPTRPKRCSRLSLYTPRVSSFQPRAKQAPRRPKRCSRLSLLSSVRPRPKQSLPTRPKPCCPAPFSPPRTRQLTKSLRPQSLRLATANSFRTRPLPPYPKQSSRRARRLHSPAYQAPTRQSLRSL